MGLDDSTVLTHQRGERDRLRRRQRHVHAGTVMDGSVAFLPAQLPPVRDETLQHLLERVGFHGAGQPHGLGAPTVPGARFTVRGIVLGVVAVLLEVAHALGRGADLADGRYHELRSAILLCPDRGSSAAGGLPLAKGLQVVTPPACRFAPPRGTLPRVLPARNGL